jgi:outer membrane receptor for monomeric catechols
MEDQQSIESGVYISDQFRLSSKITLDAGLRVSHFQAIGPSTVYQYKSGETKDVANITDTLYFESGDIIKSFSNFEPRAGLRFEISPNASVKASYHRMVQYLHLVTNATAITPVDIWQPSGYYFKPQLADQFSLGYFFNFKEKAYEAFVEIYYKTINNVLDFKDGAQLILNEQIETDLIQGTTEAYGVETQLVKKSGRLNGSISYTYSRSFQTLNGPYPEETINNGEPFPSNFDQPHVVNLNWKYTLSKRIFFTGGFTYHTGRPISLPLSAFYVGNITISSFSERNQYRIPDYHRLDLGLVVEGSHKRKRLFDGTWTFSIYNVYARKNPYTIFFQEDRPGILRPYKLSIIGTALPSITYSLKF